MSWVSVSTRPFVVYDRRAHTTKNERGCRHDAMSGYRLQRSLAASRAAIFYRNQVSESEIFAALRASYQLSVAILESIPYLPIGVTASGGLKHTLPTPRRWWQFYPTMLDTQIRRANFVPQSQLAL